MSQTDLIARVFKLALLAGAALCLWFALTLPILNTEIDYIEALAGALGENVTREMIERPVMLFAGGDTSSMVENSSVSVLEGSRTLYDRGAWVSFVLVFGFSAVLPVFKVALFALDEATFGRLRAVRPVGNAIMAFHKWSLLDVMVVSAVVFTLSDIPFLSVSIAPAAYWYVGYVVLLQMLHLYDRFLRG